MAQMQYSQPYHGMLKDFPDEVMSDRWLRVKCDPVHRCGTNNFEREGSALDWRKALHPCTTCMWIPYHLI